jgi:hypothetical protein
LGYRVGLGVMPTHYRRGWHITATCGIFGAAAACARLIGLDARRTAWALGHAATQSASLVESLGSMAKSLGVGNAAKNGLAGRSGVSVCMLFDKNSGSQRTRRWRKVDSNPLLVARTPGFLRLSSPSGGSKWTPYWITFGLPPTRINRQPAEGIQFEVHCPL